MGKEVKIENVVGVKMEKLRDKIEKIDRELAELKKRIETLERIDCQPSRTGFYFER